MEDKSSNDIDSFCGWHLDHGGVTTLLSPLYLDLDGNPVEKPDTRSCRSEWIQEALFQFIRRRVT